MLRSYFKMAFRSFFRNKNSAFINLFGLSIGVCCCILVMLYVRSEFSYNKFHSKADRLYRAWMVVKDKDRGDFTSTITSMPIGPSLQEKLPDVEYTSRVCKFNTLVMLKDKSFNETVHMVDTTFFKMFDFKLKQGSLGSPWPSTNSLIISETLAKKYFGNDEAFGKTLEVQLNNDTVLFTISGVVKNNPTESSITLDLLIPFSNDHFLFNDRMRAWGNIASTETYVLLKRNTTSKLVENKFPEMLREVLRDKFPPGAFNIHLQPITDIHLNTSLPEGLEPVSNPKYSYILSTIGIFILMIACINFITLSIGRSTSRALEVGVRKVLGAERKQLISQFFGEAFLLTILSIITGFLMTLLFFKPFTTLLGKDLSWSFDYIFIIFCFLLIAFIAFSAGIYPALFLSKFNPIEVLKGKLKFRNNIGIFRKGLITVQFMVSITMIVCTWVVGQQLNFLKNKDLGYNKEDIVVINTDQRPADGMQLAKRYQNTLVTLPDVASSSIVMFSLDEEPWATMGFIDGKHNSRSFQFNAVDAGFVKTMQIPLAAGNNFFSDDDSSVLVNEAFVKEYGWENPIGHKLPGPFPQTITGVIKDFNTESLHTTIKPLVLATGFDAIPRVTETMLYQLPLKPKVLVRLRPGNIVEQMKHLKQNWQPLAPGQQFNYSFLNEGVDAKYREDARTGEMVKMASAISIFISCIGLFGLVALTVTNRTKEIAIRKVLGATVTEIIALISKEFLLLVTLAAFISFPLSLFAMRSWLNDFAFRIVMSWWIFCLAGAFALLIALCTIIMQSLNAATINPAKAIRME